MQIMITHHAPQHIQPPGKWSATGYLRLKLGHPSATGWSDFALLGFALELLVLKLHLRTA